MEFSITYNSEMEKNQKDIDLGIQPLDRFDTLKDLNKQLANNISRLKFDYMTPIQKIVIPYMQQGRDVMGCSETGSGKTIAYLFPVISSMLTKGPPLLEGTSRKTAYPISLILVPTRELADQVYKESKKMCYQTGINTVRVYGGVPYDSQISSLSLGCDILVSTPGRLIDYLKTSTISLKAINTLIIDEADRILDMGFEDQLNTIIFTYDLPPKGKRQNLMLSATFSPEVRKIARKFMNEFYFVQPKTVAPKQIKQEIIKASEAEKNQMLSQILQKLHGSIIIFLDTKRGVDSLSCFLYNSRFKCCSIHGDKKQNQRQNAIENFTLGNVPILIATDVASRGLDFPNVNLVVNYDLPKNLEDYIHRIGRTGRMGQEGTAISFINEGNKPIIKKLYLFFKSQGQVIPPWFEEMYVKDGEEDRNRRTAKFKMNMNFSRPNSLGYMTNMNRNIFNGYRMNNMPSFPNSNNSNSTGIVSLPVYGMNGNSTVLPKNDTNPNGNNQINGFSQFAANQAYVNPNVNTDQLNDNSINDKDRNHNNNALNSNITYQNQLMYYQNQPKMQRNNVSQGYSTEYNIHHVQRTNYHHSSYHNNNTSSINTRNNDRNHNHSNRSNSNTILKGGEGERGRSKSKSKENNKAKNRSHSRSHSKTNRNRQSYKDTYHHRLSNRITRSKSRSRSKNRRQHYRSRSNSHSRNKQRERIRDRDRDRDRSGSRSRSLRNRNKSKSISRSHSRDNYSRVRRRIDSPNQSRYRNTSRDHGNKNNSYYYSNRNRSNGRDSYHHNTNTTNC